MPFRYTIAELEKDKGSEDYMSDFKMLRAVITERQETITNMYSPLNKRLNKLKAKIDAWADEGLEIEDICNLMK